MNTIRQIQALNKRELENVVPPTASWHTDYRDTAYVYIGGLPFDLTEGDIVTIFSQFGEPVWLKLARDKETGKSKGFAWLKYEDQRSTDLAVDNLGGATVLGRIVRVDHARYTKKDEDADESEFNVAFEDPRKDEDHDTHRRERRKHRRKDRRSPTRSRKQIEDEIERSDEDPMKDYLAEEDNKTNRRRSRDRRGDGERRHSKERKRDRHRDDDDQDKRHSSHKHRRHRSPRDERTYE